MKPEPPFTAGKMRAPSRSSPGLAAELPHVDADKAWTRLERLTETQRTAIEDVLGRVTVAAPDPEAARTVAAHALDEEISALGLRRV
jgi:hypothetical protein